MPPVARLATALVLALAAPAALAATCTSAHNDQYPSGRKPVLSNADLNEQTVSICYQDYNLYASKVTGTNLWSAQHLTRAKVIGAESISRIDSSFFSEPGFPTKHASYTNSGYDRGHMMPAGDASTTPAQKETFSVANIVPQTGKLNRGSWAKIENIVRTVAKEWDAAYVVTGPDFDNMNTTIASGAVVVPTQTWKAVYVPSAGVAGAYWCVNSTAPTCSLISLNELKRRAFVDPFPSLGTALRAQTASDWTDILVLP
ncbi:MULTISPECIES: DNA/RNA non-specific endonuclease [Lysobacter]|uniref:Endonuclease n=2 Tax=Lysobacter TaxID=68 RepID=A0A0S2DH78_LYSEN|nr:MULTISPECIES: DNA/RNA non-specific endonuclease [Lysobacter]ALN57742.1 DNA/RNA non-specific endonuclease [Lysobacter enzymogenes]QCW26282.1 DNA/RNA non-specific endonuclease [Lysobacter enzymogenes]QQP99135.1 DNA/RNA non-specific endonuclease [Lysobacter enzymogenes]UZW58582.1 DNA/RNA non-specific endonuclease [Lysobacter enzymogenes]WMT02294.1 DNA/RNA non-specific endonuclease [Lysobacter yananisis]